MYQLTLLIRCKVTAFLLHTQAFKHVMQHKSMLSTRARTDYQQFSLLLHLKKVRIWYLQKSAL